MQNILRWKTNTGLYPGDTIVMDKHSGDRIMLWQYFLSKGTGKHVRSNVKKGRAKNRTILWENVRICKNSQDQDGGSPSRTKDVDVLQSKLISKTRKFIFTDAPHPSD
ncbi:hypothetical protein XENORESO_007654 [Xenotaenia resolanae]|uniref:Uncharacterized protein n=1 Tax=Xenotaenia resolanae TaxID=208358 RepID=A0ABV0WBZ6_9TELE